MSIVKQLPTFRKTVIPQFKVSKSSKVVVRGDTSMGLRSAKGRFARFTNRERRFLHTVETHDWPNFQPNCLARLLYIQQVLDSNPGAQTGYSDRHVWRFSLVVLENACRVRQVWPMYVKLSSARDEGIRGSGGKAPFILIGIMWRRLRSTSFAIHTSLIATLFVTIFPEL
jgi:hypothetical protein